MSYAVKRVFHLYVTLNRIIPSLVIPADSHKTTAQLIRSDAHRGCYPPDYSLQRTLTMDFSRFFPVFLLPLGLVLQTKLDSCLLFCARSYIIVSYRTGNRNECFEIRHLFCSVLCATFLSRAVCGWSIRCGSQSMVHTARFLSTVHTALLLR